MAVGPVSVEAQRVIRPGFDRDKGDRIIPLDSIFFLRSFPHGNDGHRQYFGGAQLIHLGSRRDTNKSRARKSLKTAFDQAKEQGEIPSEAIFEVVETVERGVTLRWAGARVDSWGNHVGLATVCD